MIFAFIRAERACFPVTVMCEVLKVSRSGFYAWCLRPEFSRAALDQPLFEAIEASHSRSRKVYGSPRIHADLRASGMKVGQKRVARVMRENGLQGACKRRFKATTDSKHSDRIEPNLLERAFEVKAPNQVWTTDVTGLWTNAGWVFLGVMLDLFSRRVVGYAMSQQNDTALAVATLELALKQRRPPRGLMHHSDRGSPYASDAYRALEAKHGLVVSMSNKGDCWDNAVSESFFATLKTELGRSCVYRTHAEAVAAVEDYIEKFYNPYRRHSTRRPPQPDRVRAEAPSRCCDRLTQLSTKPGELQGGPGWCGGSGVPPGGQIRKSLLLVPRFSGPPKPHVAPRRLRPSW